MSQDDFAQWLRDRGYRESTVNATLRAVRRAGRAWHDRGELPAAVHSSLRRFATYLRDRQPALSTFDRAVQTDPAFADVRTMRAAPRRRKQAAQSFTDANWRALQNELAGDSSPEGIVLLLMATTGHRVGDILRIYRRGLLEARKSGVLLLERKGGDVIEVPLEGAQGAWDRLFAAWKGAEDDQVADWVCPDCEGGAEAGQGAYRRVQRHLKRVGTRLGLDGRVHLHRLRRTVGVRALQLTRDVHLVSQLLGHQSVKSTEAYVDELRRDDLVDLQKKLRDE